MLITQERLPTLELSSMNEAHAQEIALITKLDSVAKENDTKAVLEGLNKLIEHTATYFVEEEKLMKAAEFPEYGQHQYEHAKQLMDLKSIQSFYEMTNDTKSVESYLKDALTPWIVEHVHDVDAPTAEFLNQ